jgi:hypothetical protein
MPTPYLPVTCACSMCELVYVEWFSADECKGKTRQWRPKIRCDNCYAPRMSADERSNLIRLMVRRRRKMHEMYAANADLKFLDIVHAEMIRNGRDVYVAHSSCDKSRHSQSVADRTDASSL